VYATYAPAASTARRPPVECLPYNPNGTQTRHQPGNPPKITRSQFENHERCQFGIQQQACATRGIRGKCHSFFHC
jgi:hypothetical protein